MGMIIKSIIKIKHNKSKYNQVEIITELNAITVMLEFHYSFCTNRII